MPSSVGDASAWLPAVSRFAQRGAQPSAEHSRGLPQKSQGDARARGQSERTSGVVSHVGLVENRWAAVVLVWFLVHLPVP